MINLKFSFFNLGKSSFRLLCKVCNFSFFFLVIELASCVCVVLLRAKWRPMMVSECEKWNLLPSLSAERAVIFISIWFWSSFLLFLSNLHQEIRTTRLLVNYIFLKFFFLVRLSVGIHRLQEKASFEYFWTCFLYVLLNYTIILVTILKVLRVIYIGSDSSVFYSFLFLICLHNTFCCSFTHR